MCREPIFNLKRKKLRCNSVLELKGRPKGLKPLDYEILKILMKNARLSYEEIARQLQSVTSVTVRNRISRMRAKGIIKSFKACIDAKSLGYNVGTFVDIYLEKQTYLDSIIKFLQDLNGISNIYRFASDFQIRVLIYAKKINDLNEIITQISQREGIKKLKQDPIMDYPSIPLEVLL